MQWSKLWDDAHEPSDSQIQQFVNTPLWDELAHHLQQAYHVAPTLFYSCCSMDNGFWKGWNLKYKKSGKALCALYPKQGFFVALIAVGAKEMAEIELLLPFCDRHTQHVYEQTTYGKNGKSLVIAVTDEAILRDVKNLIAIRADARK